MNAPLRIAVVGAGAAGLGIAAVCRRTGAQVLLFNRGEERLAAVRQRGGILASFPGRGPEVLAGVEPQCDLRDAVGGADAVFVTTNSDAHVALCGKMAPYLRANALVTLVPGHTWGAQLAAAAIAQSRGCDDVVCGEFQALPFVARMEGDEVQLREFKRVVFASVLQESHADAAFQLYRRLFDHVERAPSALWPSLHNMTIVVQPALAFANLGRIEAGHPFRFYQESGGPGVERMLQALDAERLSVARALGIPQLMTAVEWHAAAYGVEAGRLVDTLARVSGYRDIRSPVGLEHRFLNEHVRCGLVPLEALGLLLGVATPRVSALIELCATAVGVNLRETGRNYAALSKSWPHGSSIRGYGSARVSGAASELVAG